MSEGSDRDGQRAPGHQLVAGYHAELASHPDPARRVGWRGAADQALRFEVIAAALPLERCASVLDVGCGLGDLAPFLRRRGWRGRYLGVDLLDEMVDWNEVRVSSPSEINKSMGASIPDGVARSHRLTAALQAVFDLENRLSLDRLKSMGRREAKQYLEKLDGVDEYAVASVLLWGLGGHAIPVSDRLLETLRQADLIHPSANRGEVQAFLERHISAADTKEFCLVMRSFRAPGEGAKRRARSAAARKTKKAAT